MKWVLVVFLATSDGPHAVVHDFESESACEAAADVFRQPPKSARTYRGGVSAVCIKDD